jgi:hypothetical protein
LRDLRIQVTRPWPPVGSWAVCYFITAAVAGANADEVNAALRRAGSDGAFADAGASPIRAQLKAGEVYLEHRSGAQCDCGTQLGSANRASGPSAVSAATSRAVAKLRAKGWGDARIRRWREQRAHAAERGNRPERGTPATPDNESWATAIRAVLEGTHASRFGLALHWYSGSPSREEFRLLRSEFPLPALSVALLAGVPEDTLCWFLRG